MFSPITVVLAILAYMGGLFLLAQWSERSPTGKKLSSHPIVYALGLAVYCTTWTYYGSVGKASSGGMGFIPVYLGPTVAMLLGHSIFRKIARLKQAHRITSIADFVSSRYGKSQGVAAIVTVILMIGIVPYVGLQLKAVSGTFKVLTTTAGGELPAIAGWISPLTAVLMTAFTIVFGIRHLDPTERHPGMVTSLAAESLVKLTAFVAAGAYVVGTAFGDLGVFFEHLRTAAIDLPMMGRGDTNQTLVWLTVGVLSMSAFAFLPRQFHVGVVENSDDKSIKTAMWLTPLYLLAINVLVVPIAMGGALVAAPGTPGDQYVLALPVQGGQSALSLAVFVGGFSAAIGMIMIEGMTTATMISNHLLMPLFRALPGLAVLQRKILYVRWVAAAAFIGAGYAFEVVVGDSYMLVAIGLVSFAAAFVVAPILLGGLFWRSASRIGAIAGLSAGFVTWAFTLLIPTFIKSHWLPQSILTDGLFGNTLLRPEAFLGLEGLPSLTHGVLWSGGLCVAVYVTVSAIWAPSKEERQLTDEFLDHATVFSGPGDGKATILAGELRSKTMMLMGRFFEKQELTNACERCFSLAGCSDLEMLTVVQHADLHNRVEKSLAGAIGAATAHAVMKEWGTIARTDTKALTMQYAKMMARMKLSPREIKERVDYQEEREGLLKEQFQALALKIEERDEEILERQRAELRLQEAHDLLEQRVQERTSELAQRGKDMRLVLDNVDQGFVTISPDGKMSNEMSAVVETWLGKNNKNGNVCSYLGGYDPSMKHQLSFGLDTLQQGFLDPLLCLDQLPKQFKRDGQTLEARYQPVSNEGEEISKILIVLSDVTQELKHRQTESMQREILHALDRVMHDRVGFFEFIADAHLMLDKISNIEMFGISEIARMIHTLKGNAAMFGVESIASICHRIEDRMAEERNGPKEQECQELVDRLAQIESTFGRLLGEERSHNIELSEAQFTSVLKAAENGITGNTLTQMITEWTLEESNVRLQRLKLQAESLATRLNRAVVQVDVRANEVRLKPEYWASFWSSLVHVIRNGVDHGIETTTERQAMGKSEHGNLLLSTEVRNEHLVVVVSDDGRGIDWNKIRTRAMDLELPCSTQEQLAQAIFFDGLSTRETASEYSGRGLGMAVVKAECEHRNGTIQIVSNPGKGTKFRFEFPLPKLSQPTVAA